MPQWIVDVWTWATESPIGSGITVAAILGIVALIVRRSRRAIFSRARRLWKWLRSIRFTTQTRIDQRVKEAVSEATAPPNPEDPGVLAEAQNDRYIDWMLDKQKQVWVIVRHHAQRYLYVLENASAGDAEDVSLTAWSTDSFELMSTVEWKVIKEGERVGFNGRRLATDFGLMSDSKLLVRWTDGHGDQQQKRIPIPK